MCMSPTCKCDPLVKRLLRRVHQRHWYLCFHGGNQGNSKTLNEADKIEVSQFPGYIP